MEDAAELTYEFGDQVEIRPVDNASIPAQSLFELTQASCELEVMEQLEILRLLTVCLSVGLRNRYSPLASELRDANVGNVRDLISASGAAPGPTAKLLRLHDKHQKRLGRGITQDERQRVATFASVLPFMSASADASSYAYLEDARDRLDAIGAAKRMALSRGEALERARQASLAVGAIRRLPTTRDLEWGEVNNLRGELRHPLAKFRRAMDKLSRDASADPRRNEFEDYVERIWVEEIDPALAELGELSQQNSLRSLFWDVASDIKSYSSPIFALAAGTYVDLPAGIQAGVAVATPIASALMSKKSANRALRGHDYYFLHAVGRAAH